MSVDNIASKAMLFPSMTEKTQFPGFTFPKVVQRH